MAVWFVVDGRNGDGERRYVNDQMPRYTPLLLYMNYSKELDWKMDEAINLVFRYILTILKQDGGGLAQQVS